MKAIVEGIESGAAYTDKQVRVTLRIEEADQFYRHIRVKAGLLNLDREPRLDQEIEFTLGSVDDKKHKTN